MSKILIYFECRLAIVGSTIVRKLIEIGYSNIVTLLRSDFDLMNQCQVKRFLNKKNLIRIIWSLRG